MAKLGFSTDVRGALNEHYRLSQLKGRRTREQEIRYRELMYWYGQYRRVAERAGMMDQAGRHADAKRMRDSFSRRTEDLGSQTPDRVR